MEHIGRDRHQRPRRDVEIADPILRDRGTAQKWRRRIEPHRLVDHGARVDEAIEMLGAPVVSEPSTASTSALDPRANTLVLRDQVERPGQGVGGGLVAGADEGHDIGVDVGVAQTLARFRVRAA